MALSGDDAQLRVGQDGAERNDRVALVGGAFPVRQDQVADPPRVVAALGSRVEPGDQSSSSEAHRAIVAREPGGGQAAHHRTSWTACCCRSRARSRAPTTGPSARSGSRPPAIGPRVQADLDRVNPRWTSRSRRRSRQCHHSATTGTGSGTPGPRHNWQLCGEVRCGRRSAGPGSSCCRVYAAAATAQPHHST